LLKISSHDDSASDHDEGDKDDKDKIRVVGLSTTSKRKVKNPFYKRKK